MVRCAAVLVACGLAAGAVRADPGDPREAAVVSREKAEAALGVSAPRGKAANALWAANDWWYEIKMPQPVFGACQVNLVFGNADAAYGDYHLQAGDVAFALGDLSVQAEDFEAAVGYYFAAWEEYEEAAVRYGTAATRYQCALELMLDYPPPPAP